MVFRLRPSDTPLVILSEGCFGSPDSKTATGVIKYGDWPIVAVIDSTQAGKTVREVTGIECDAPVVASLEQALPLGPKALLLGTAPRGGVLPPSWKAILHQAIDNGLHLVSGLHSFLNDEPDLVERAKTTGVLLWDVRQSDQAKIVATKKPRPARTKVITLVGSDCCVGKMFTALELYKAAKDSGRKAHFIATGQTGILISGSGTPLDRVIGDFMAGHVERCIFEAIDAEQPELIFVEGQGSLLHPGYSGVTMSLLHGSNPDALILCHKAGLTSIDEYEVPIVSLKKLVEIHEEAASWTNGGQRNAKVTGISINCSGLSDEEAREVISRAQDETGLPATDPVRFGVEALLKNTEVMLAAKSGSFNYSRVR